VSQCGLSIQLHLFSIALLLYWYYVDTRDDDDDDDDDDEDDDDVYKECGELATNRKQPADESLCRQLHSLARSTYRRRRHLA